MDGVFLTSILFDCGKGRRWDCGTKIDDQLWVLASPQPAFDGHANSQVESLRQSDGNILDVHVANIDRHSSERCHSGLIDGIGSQHVGSWNDIIKFEKTLSVCRYCVVADTGSRILRCESNVWQTAAFRTGNKSGHSMLSHFNLANIRSADRLSAANLNGP